MENKAVTTNTWRSKLFLVGYKLKKIGKAILESPITYVAVAGFVGHKISDNVMEHDYSATAKIGHAEFTLTKNPQKS